MKKIILVLVILFIGSCTDNPVKKPANLLDQETMEAVLLDISLLQATSSFAPSKLVEHNLKTNEFIFKKYQIDSATLTQNQLYYAANIKVYEKMSKNILSKIESLQEESDTLLKKENPKRELLAE